MARPKKTVGKPASPNMTFAVEQLKKNPRLEFAALKAAADKKGLKMIPIIFGRAKLALGIAKQGPGPGRRPKAAKPASVASTPAPRGRRGGRRSTGGGDLETSLEQLSVAVRESAAHRRALEQIRAILSDLG